MSTDSPDDTFAALFETTKQQPSSRRRGARIGEEVEAVVVQVGRDAVFVEYDVHRQGFVESIDLRATDGTMNVVVGQSIRVRIVQVDDQGVRLEPTTEAAVLVGASVSVGGAQEPEAVKIAVGQAITGVVHRVEPYGVFLQIDGTTGRLGRGLIPTVELGTARGTDLKKAFPLGAKLKAKVIEIGEGKIRLSVRGLKDDEERAHFDGFRETEKAGAPQTLGTLGDLFKARKPK